MSLNVMTKARATSSHTGIRFALRYMNTSTFVPIAIAFIVSSVISVNRFWIKDFITSSFSITILVKKPGQDNRLQDNASWQLLIQVLYKQYITAAICKRLCSSQSKGRRGACACALSCTESRYQMCCRRMRSARCADRTMRLRRRMQMSPINTARGVLFNWYAGMRGPATVC